MQGWWTWEAMGKATPDQVAKVRELYQQYQAVESIAETAYVTSAKLNDQTVWTTAAATLRATQTELLALIEQFQKKGP